MRVPERERRRRGSRVDEDGGVKHNYAERKIILDSLRVIEGAKIAF